MKQKYLNLFLLLQLIFLPPAFGDLTVVLTPPELDLGAGEEQLGDLLQDHISLVEAEIQDIVENTINRPTLLRAVANANALNMSLPEMKNSISIGASGSFAAQTFSYKEIEDQIDDLDSEDDPYLGAGLQGLSAQVHLPLDQFVKGLSFFGAGGYLDTRYLNYRFNAILAHGSAIYTLFSPRENQSKRKPLRWEGVFLQSGFQFSLNKIFIQTSAPEPIEESFVIDPDGSGPLFGETVTVQIQPDFNIGIQTRTYSFPASISTAIKILDFFRLSGGAGLSWSTGSSSIFIEADDDIEVLGYLSDVQQAPGTLRIEGSTEDIAPDQFSWYFLAGFQYILDSFYISVPLTFAPDKGIRGGIYLGLSS